MSEATPAARMTAALGWMGLVFFFLWQELLVENTRLSGYPTVLWYRIPVTLILALVILVFAIECLLQEMTVRRWATSVLVFAVFGVLLLLGGIFNPERTFHLPRWILFPTSVYYLFAATLAAAGAKDVL